MFDGIDMGERHSRVLAELAEVGMTMVRRLSEAMLQARDPQTQAQLGLAFHRASRAVRQTLALEFRLAQEARRLERDVATLATTAPPSPARAVGAPRPPSERTGWDEYESSDSDELLDELDVLLEGEDLDLEAVHEAVESCIASIRHDLDIELPEAGIALRARGGPAEGRRRVNGPPPTASADSAPAADGEGLAVGRANRPPPPSAARRSALLGASACLRPPSLASPLHAWRSSA